MVITPDSNVKLIKCPLELNQNQQLDFANANAQYAYFNGLPKREFDDFTYVRKDNMIRIPVCVDDVWNYNYVLYQNQGFGNKWFYAAIERMEFVNPNCTYVYIRTDVWQTWQFDITMKQCYVEREHVTNDSIGLHTIPENVELGDIINNGQATNITLADSSDGYLAIGVTELIEAFSDTGQKNWLRVYGGIFSGLTYAFFNSYVSASYFIRAYDLAGKADAIQTIFYVGYDFIKNSNPTTKTYLEPPYETTITWIDPSDNPISKSYSVAKPGSLAGYVPKNNKLFTYPYCYMNVTNNAGIEIPFHYELFDGTPRFTVSQVITPSMSACLTPSNYNNGNLDSEYDQSIPAAKTPQCSWNSDVYTNWVTQNGVNISVDMMNAGLGAGLSVVSGDIIGGSMSLLNSVTSTLARAQQASIIPNQIRGNMNSGDIHFSNNKCAFTVAHRCIKNEYAKMIDDYFSMFGYKVNSVKTPQWNSRPTWNYVKTIGCTFEGDFPQEDAAELRAMFDAGLTIWHIPAQFGNYAYNNK